MPPFFTIITATYNAEACIPPLLESLATQVCRDFVWVVQDGSSSDATLDIIETWRERLSSVSVESVPDRGIYDAWNRALARQGEQLGRWVLFLGADDMLVDANVLQRVKAALTAQSLDTTLGVGDLICSRLSNSGDTLSVDISQSFTRRLAGGMPLPHSSLFASCRLLQGYPFDTSFRIAGDYDWLLRVWNSVEQAVPLGFVVTHMGSGGVSDNPATAALLRAENRCVMRRYPPRLVGEWPLYLYAYLESSLFPLKLHVKHLAQSCAWSSALWDRLRKIRKRWFGKP